MQDIKISKYHDEDDQNNCVRFEAHLVIDRPREFVFDLLTDSSRFNHLGYWFLYTKLDRLSILDGFKARSLFDDTACLFPRKVFDWLPPRLFSFGADEWYLRFELQEVSQSTTTVRIIRRAWQEKASIVERFLKKSLGVTDKSAYSEDSLMSTAEKIKQYFIRCETLWFSPDPSVTVPNGGEPEVDGSSLAVRVPRTQRFVPTLDGVVQDLLTNLIWMTKPHGDPLTWSEATTRYGLGDHVDSLHEEDFVREQPLVPKPASVKGDDGVRFAGIDGWRLPTTSEFLTLTRRRGIYADPRLEPYKESPFTQSIDIDAFTRFVKTPCFRPCDSIVSRP